MKLCPKCGLRQAATSFHRNKRQKGGLAIWCKSCCKITSQAHYRKTRAKRLKQAAVWAAANPKKVKGYGVAWRLKNQAKLHLIRLKSACKNFGISVSQYFALLEAQNGSCAICHGQCAAKQRLSIDHDHATGKLRGLLCNDCNTTLGKFNESPARFRAAASYLESHAPTH